jgi:adenosylcobyric acid synthase
MALNSYVTEDGEEMGRAQVMQAEAAGLKPKVFMNPILIKPVADKEAQIIFMGKPVKNMTALEYDTGKKEYLKKISETLEDIKKDFDIIVIEGAGSPAEINLLENDIANMAVAEVANCPVMLVGDIDKGGIFASFYGTVKILPEKFQKLFKCLLINKFRGDKRLLESGVDWIEDKVGLPVVGVVPYYRNIILDEEDSVNLERERYKTESYAEAASSGKNALKICVLYLPHISNFTDFNVLEQEPGVNLYYIRRKEELEKIDPHIIIIPGSKSTISDLSHIRSWGIEEEIKRQYARGIMVIGICGGYQMLGKMVSDPHRTESRDIDHIEGLSLINMETVFHEEKYTRQVEFRINGELLSLTGKDSPDLFKENTKNPQKGYEIHMGSSLAPDEVLCGPDEYAISLLEVTADKDKNSYLDGYIYHNKRSKQTIIGTYVHGVFDNSLFRKMVIDLAAETFGLKLEEVRKPDLDFQKFKESQYDHLADHFRKNMDIDNVYEIMEKGISDIPIPKDILKESKGIAKGEKLLEKLIESRKKDRENDK